MAASGSTTIQLYSTSTASAIPLAGNLVQGEFGVNVTDKKIYTKNGSGTVVTVGFGPDASVSLTALTGLTVVSGGASITGNSSVTGTLGVSGTVTLNGIVVNKGSTASYTSLTGGTTANTDGATVSVTGSTYAAPNTAYIDATTTSFRSLTGASTFGTFSSTGLAVTGALDTTGSVSFGTTNKSNGRVSIQAGTSASGDPLFMQNLDGTNNPYLWVRQSSAGTKLYASSSSGGAASNLVLASSGVVVLASAGVDAATVSYAGLAVAGTLSMSYQINNTGTGVFELVNRNGTGIDFYVNSASLRAGGFDASGNLQVGTSGGSNHIFQRNTDTISQVATFVNHAATTANQYGIVIALPGDPNNSTNYFINGLGNVTQRFIVYSNGNVQNTNNSYGAISDIKHKQDITDATPKLAKLLKVRIVNYKLKSDPDGIKQIGVIAQELEEISPGLIEETPDFEEVTLTREVEKTIAITVKKEVTTSRVQLEVIDGVAVQKVIKEVATVDEPVVDEYPVFDGDGNPVMEVVTPATDAELDDKGNEVKAASPAVLRQKIHTVTRMETVVEKEEYTERRLTGTTTKSVKYSVFVPMLIKAMQEQQEQIEALKAKVGA